MTEELFNPPQCLGRLPEFDPEATATPWPHEPTITRGPGFPRLDLRKPASQIRPVPKPPPQPKPKPIPPPKPRPAGSLPKACDDCLEPSGCAFFQPGFGRYYRCLDAG